MGRERDESDARVLGEAQQGRQGPLQVGGADLPGAAVPADGPDAGQRLQVGGERGRVRLGVQPELDDVGRPQRRDELARRALRDDAAAVDDGDAVAQDPRFVHVVGGQQDAAARGPELLQHRPELPARLRVEPGRGLVEEQQLGVADERAPHGQPLPLPARQLADPRARLGLEAQGRQHRRRRTSPAVERPEQAQGLPHRQPLVELRLLQVDAQPLAQRVVVFAPPRPQHLDRPRVRRLQTLEDLDGRRLAGPVGSQQAEALAAEHREVQMVDRGQRAVALHEPRATERRPAGRGRRRCGRSVHPITPVANSTFMSTDSRQPRRMG